MPACVIGMAHRRGSRRHQPRVARHQDADDEAGREQDVREIVGAEVAMNLERVSGLMAL